ncbi:MAG: hypothetical protein OEZ59_08460, partial [Deltaproteobacteria bacterium]|nr:hypothetical protein [Deltaproteobacteria bacterium]
MEQENKSTMVDEKGREIIGEARWKVTNEDCAKAQGSGDMDVLSTPRVAALMEQAACEALSRAGFLAHGQTTVGVRLD